MTVEHFQRVSATNPGKHGERDWRIAIRDIAPTHAETLYMLGMKLIAEDRYSEPHHRGRGWLLDYVELLATARTPEEVREIAEDCLSIVTRKAVA